MWGGTGAYLKAYSTHILNNTLQPIG